MKGLIWNVRGLNQPGRILNLGHLIRSNNVDFVGIQEIKREEFPHNFLKNLVSPGVFSWHFLLAKGTAGGILLGTRADSFLINNAQLHDFAISCIIQDLTTSFSWKLVVVYGPSYGDKKTLFIDELHKILASWQGPWFIGGDFNLSRFPSDKSTGRINQNLAYCFNDWINRWGLIEVNPSNRKFTWSNNQEKAVLAKLDRIFVPTDWEAAFPLVRVSALPKNISGHNPLLVDNNNNNNQTF
jgi:exonuclease III